MAKLRAYIEDVADEMVNKVSWPTAAELQSSAVIVLVASVMIAMIIWVMDYAFGINGAGSDDVLWRGVLGWFYKFIG